MRSRLLRPRNLVVYFVLGITLVVFVRQLETLYTVPVFDSVRWGGDETWLMREFGNQAHRGVMSYPESFGGRPRTDGVLAGSMWVDALLYGTPGYILFPKYDYVTVGRTVTAILSLILILSLYLILRKLGASAILSSASLALMVLSQGFVWASHSERYDLLTGLVLIWYVFFLSRLETGSKTHMAVIGAVGILLLCFSRHLLMLGLPVSLVFVYRQQVWKHWDLFFSWVAGAVIAFLVLSALYMAGAHEFSLFGQGGTEGSYAFVIGQIPILRPFSRNVQISNIEERWNLFLKDAPGVLILLLVVILFFAFYKFRQFAFLRRGVHFHVAITRAQRFFLASSFFCSMSWLLMEGSRPYYLFHLVPVLIVAAIIVLELWSEIFPSRWFGESGGLLLLTGSIAVAASHAIPNNVLGIAVARDQSAAIPQLLREAAISEPRKTRVLVDVAGLDRALIDTARHVLTLDMFQPPSDPSALMHKLHVNQIDYVILRSSPVSSPFEPGRAMLPHVLDSVGILCDSSLGFFYDDGRNYDASLSHLIDEGLDTLKLYRVPEMP